MPEIRRTRNVKRARQAVPIVLVIASLLMLTISTRRLEGVPKRIGLSIFGFFQQGFSHVGNFARNTITSVTELRQLRKEYASLLVKLESYANVERGNAELQQENERLKTLLGYSSRIQYEKIPSRIVAKDPENNFATIIIDKGVESGVRKNYPVVAFQDGIEGLVGRVSEVGRGTSIVVPLYDSTSYIAARFANSRYEGLVAGRGSVDEPLLMKFVKKRAKDEIQFGDLIVTSGYESIYPPDIAIARVIKTSALDYQTSLEIDLEPILDFSRMEYVVIIKPTDTASNDQARGTDTEGTSRVDANAPNDAKGTLP